MWGAIVRKRIDIFHAGPGILLPHLSGIPPETFSTSSTLLDDLGCRRSGRPLAVSANVTAEKSMVIGTFNIPKGKPKAKVAKTRNRTDVAARYFVYSLTGD